MKDFEPCDVIVVGAGSAAFAAAVSARLHGAEKVVMVEKAPEEHSGGNLRYSEGGIRFVHEGSKEIRQFLHHIRNAEFESYHLPPYREEEFLTDLKNLTHNQCDLELADKLVAESNYALHWLLELGHEWNPGSFVDIDGMKYFERGLHLRFRGGGVQQLKKWRDIADRMKIDIRFESRVSALLGSDNKIEGVSVSASHGEYVLSGRAVILCAGGFQANAQKRAQYLGQNAELMKVRGSRYDTGEVLEMALALGAKPSGQWELAHGSPLSLNAPDVECKGIYNRYSYPLGITVNTAGVRFFDEGEDESTYTYAKTGFKILAQPKGIAYQIYDQQTAPLLRGNYVLETAIEADCLEELAEKLAIHPKVFLKTVHDFNQSVNGAVEVDYTHKDGKNSLNLDPPKSNWAVRIEKPPFLAYPVTGGITFTYGGVSVNTNAQVINTAGNAIEGLYAVGDIVGMFYHNYPACAGLTRNFVFGRLAGRHAVL